MRTGAAFIVTLALLLQTGVAGASEAGGDDADVAKWIERSCPASPSLETLVRLDQLAGKAIMDRLRLGRYRSSVQLANVYLACWARQGANERLRLFEPRLRALRQIACFVPLVVFESEGRVDPDLARESLASCPEPADRPESGDDAAGRAWAEEIRRRLHLVASFESPEQVLGEAERWLVRMQAAGILAPDGNARWAHGTGTDSSGSTAADAGAATGKGPADAVGGDAGSPVPDATGGDATSSDATATGNGAPAAGDEGTPDPVFAVRVLAAGAAVASGNLDRLVAAFGGPEKACGSMFLAALGFLQAVDLPRQAALPMILRSLVGRASLDAMVDLDRRVAQRFGDKPCAVQALVSSLALASVSPAVLDAAVKDGGVERIVGLAAAAPSVIPVRGSAASRAAILDRLVGRLQGGDRLERLCQLGDARIDTGEIDAALKAFEEAGAAAPDDRHRTCAIEGRLRAMIQGGRTRDPAFAAVATKWLETSAPVAREILARLMEPTDDGRRAEAVRSLADVVTSKDAAGRLDVLEALLKVVDDEPGTGAASAALAAVDAAGFPTDPEGRVTWDLVSGRHHVMAGEPAEARKAFRKAFAGLKPDMDQARGGVTSLMRWAAVDNRFPWLDELVPRARAAGILTVESLADLAGILGEMGERDRARKLVGMARALKPTTPRQWIALADASSRFADVATALQDLRKAGPEDEWDADAWTVQGRIASARGQHRDAVVAWAKVMEKRPGECQPRFFHGLALLMVGDPEGAETDFASCADDGNLGPQVLGALGYAQFDQSQFDEAEATFRRALSRDDKAADNHLGLAMTLLRKGQPDAALASWDRAIALEPLLAKGPAAASRKGFVYSEIQKKAWEDLDALHPGHKGGRK